MGKRKIVDAHHHLWDLGRGYHYPWLQDRPLPNGVCGDLTNIARDYVLADFQADTANYDLVKSVHIEAVSAHPVDETAWLQELADRRGFPHGIVARAELQAPDVEQILAEHKRYANTRGIRHIVNWHRDPRLTFGDRNDLMTDPAWLAGFRLLKKYDLSFDLQLYPSQMADAAELAHRHPDTRIILNHAGMPVDRDPAGLALWRDGMARLAAEENVVAKISGLGMVDWHWNIESIRPFVLGTIDAFGVDRTMFGSNFPVDKLYGSFDDLYGAFESIVTGFSEAEKQKLFHDNAVAYYRL